MELGGGTTEIQELTIARHPLIGASSALELEAGSSASGSRVKR